jgi:hypothetical protein
VAFDGSSMKAFHFPDLGEELHEAPGVEGHAHLPGVNAQSARNQPAHRNGDLLRVKP